jgi:hypothetical protein
MSPFHVRFAANAGVTGEKTRERIVMTERVFFTMELLLGKVFQRFRASMRQRTLMKTKHEIEHEEYITAP